MASTSEVRRCVGGRVEGRLGVRAAADGTVPRGGFRGDQIPSLVLRRGERAMCVCVCVWLSRLSCETSICYGIPEMTNH